MMTRYSIVIFNNYNMDKDNNDTSLNYILDELYARPEWEDIESSLNVGCDYIYYVSNETSIRGRVLYNDGVTAILQVTNRYVECFFEILYYKEVKRFFPWFNDHEAQTSRKEYLCLDVETETNLFSRDTDTNKIGHYHIDERGQYVFTPIDECEFRMQRCKKLLIYRMKEIERERNAKQSSYNSTVTVCLDDTLIREMYQEYDKQHGISAKDDVLHHGINRSIYWLTHRNCAILSAWRGTYSRKENDKRNKELQQSLRSLGYGVIRVMGCYAEIGKPIEKENSFIAFDLSDTDNFMENIYNLSEHYDQDCFLYKPIDEETAYLIGTNDDYGKGKIDLVGYLHINNESTENFTKDASGTISYSKNP